MSKPVAAAMVALVLLGPLARAAEEPKPLDDRTRCIAVFKEVLAYVKCKELKAVFGKIMDGGGKGEFKVLPTDDVAKLLRATGEGQDEGKFLEKNLPHAEAILAHFDDIKFGDLQRQAGTVRVSTKGGGPKGEGELLIINIALPESAGVDVGRTDSDGLKLFSRLRFVSYNGGIYWVPFGW